MRPPLRAPNEGLPRPRVPRARRTLDSPACLYFHSHLLRFRNHFLDRTDHVKRLFR